MLRKLSVYVLILLSANAFGQSWTDSNKQIVSYYNTGHYQEGYELGTKTLEGLRKQGIRDSSYIRTIQNLAIFCNRLGKYPESVQYSQEVLPLTKVQYPLDYLAAHNTLGTTYFWMENYPVADSLFAAGISYALALYADTAYRAREGIRVLHQYCILRNSQGLLYKTLGQYQKAKSFYEEAIQLMSKQLGEYVKDTEIYLSAVNNLANVYVTLGEPEAAEQRYLETAQMHKKMSGDSSLSYLNTLNNLASLYSNTRQFDKAVQIWQNNLPLVKRVYGTQYPLYISMLINLSNVYFEQESYVKSREMALEAKELQEKQFGKENSTYQTILFNLAHVYQFEKNYDRANYYYTQVIAKLHRDIQHNFSYLTEQNKRAFYHENKLLIEEYAFFAIQRSGIIPFPDAPSNQLSRTSLSDLYDLRLATKGLILSSTEKMRTGILNSKDATLISTYRTWEGLKESIAFASGLSIPERKRLKLNPDSLKTLAETCEQFLTRRSSHFSKGFNTPKTHWKDIQKQLKPGEAAIELIRFLDGLFYVALILTPNTKKYPEAAVIKSSKDKLLDKQFFALYSNCIRSSVEDTTSYQRFWKPIQDKLDKTKDKKISKIYLSLDGIYHRINLNTLRYPASSHYVLDELDICLVTNTQEIIGQTKEKKSSGLALLAGRPDYGEDHFATKTNEPVYQDLPGTEEEIREIQRILAASHWQTKLLVDTSASETNIKSNPNPLVLHLATHGFFDPSGGEPILQSGLVLAGVHKRSSTTQDNGLLTAYEAMSLTLDSTTLVVLSACETGLGEIENGEGVYGLQRTLRLAGARTILMSLWKVDDEATKNLMVNFYRNWLKGGTKREAFRAAQLQLKEIHPEPKAWGAFVLVGE
jgi:CHAT domain-containing protein